MSLAKTLGKLAGSARALGHLLGYRIARPLLGHERAFAAASERIAKIPGMFGVYTRQAFYRRTLKRVGDDVYFGFMSVFSKPDATVGDRVYIGRFCTVGLADLGDDVMLADAVQVLSGRRHHIGEDGMADHDQPVRVTKVTIGQGAWFGAGSIVMADVGERAVVGAGAVVVKPVQAGAKVGGVPARPLGGEIGAQR